MRPCSVAVQALSHWAGSETADGVLIKRNTTIPECVLHVIHVSCVAVESENSVDFLGLLSCCVEDLFF